MGGLRVEAEKKTFERGAYLHKYKNPLHKIYVVLLCISFVTYIAVHSQYIL